jgi:hypothetical protein
MWLGPSLIRQHCSDIWPFSSNLALVCGSLHIKEEHSKNTNKIVYQKPWDAPNDVSRSTSPSLPPRPDAASGLIPHPKHHHQLASCAMYSLLVSSQPPASITNELAFGGRLFPPSPYQKVDLRWDLVLKKTGSKTAQKIFLEMYMPIKSPTKVQEHDFLVYW